MFGGLNRQLSKLLESLKEKEDAKALEERALDRLRGMGDGQDPANRPDVELKDIIRSNDVQRLMAHVEAHGLSGVRKLSQQVDANPEFQARIKAKEVAKRDFWAAAPPVTSRAQEAVLSELGDATLQSAVRDAMRTGLYFDIDLRPAEDADTSFVGGLPFVGTGLEWPRDSRTKAPLPFVGQIDLRDLPDFGLRSCLPATGALVFFVAPRTGNHPLIVQHVTMEHAKTVPLPPDAKPYHSSFVRAWTGTGKGKIGWLHEQAHEVEPFTIRPKWPLKPRVVAVAPQLPEAYELNGAVPETVLDQHEGSEDAFLRQLSSKLNGIPQAKWLNEKHIAEDFPHVWGAIADITDRFLPLVDKCKDIHGPDTPAEVHELHEIVQSWRDIAHAFGLDSKVGDKDRDGFRDVLRLMTAESGITLPGGDGIMHPKVLNPEMGVKSFIGCVQTYWVLSSLCHDPTTLSQQTRDEMVASFTADFPSKGYIQSLGHGVGKPGDEAALGNVLLMQFPWSVIPDWTGILGFEGLHFWMSYEDMRDKNFAGVFCEV